MAEAVRIAIIGTGKRSAYMYGPVLRGLSPAVRLVGVWGRSEAPSRALGERLGVKSYTDMDLLVKEARPDIGIVSVKRPNNGPVAKLALEHGMNVLVETPLADDLKDADEVIRIAREKKLKVEVSEQFHRRPLEQIKLMLIQAGLFGKVYSSFNDFAGHGYHGVSVMRSYLGFDAKPLRVTGFVRDYQLEAHYSLLANTRGPRTEKQEHGIVEFEGGRLGIYHWTSVAYDSALRWWRSSRFLAEKGMGITVGVGLDIREQLSVLAAGGEGPQFVTLEREWERCDGGALRAVKAHTGNPGSPIVTWENPFAKGPSGDNVQWHDDEIGVAGCIMSLVDAVRDNKEPTYGPLQGRLDQEIILAIQRSSAEGGKPVDLPLA